MKAWRHKQVDILLDRFIGNLVTAMKKSQLGPKRRQWGEPVHAQ
jgi:hypothetical protein